MTGYALPQIAHLVFSQRSESTLKNQKSYFFASAPKKAIFDSLIKQKNFNGYRN
jgi:hypothetical protein